MVSALSLDCRPPQNAGILLLVRSLGSAPATVVRGDWLRTRSKAVVLPNNAPEHRSSDNYVCIWSAWMGDLLQAGIGLGIFGAAGAAWRIYYLRFVRKVYKDTKDPAVLEYAKAVFDRPPVLGSPPEVMRDPPPPLPPASRRSRVGSWLRSLMSTRRPR